ncbi:MAG: flagellin [Thauera sp.]|uniref:flagellin N-terminal helical domain-containing protein n=1 Tax=Thauera sp. TaxID=1905334 RepID=UPI001D3C4386|nr:flagellin [Thauera sp.]MCA9233346.1 hypothetical protein [Planctomycetales bacterium]MCP5224907.1 flagellin [Thauera sp.]
MAQTINTNVASLNAQRQLNSSQGSLATSLQRLSSGLRINSAKDDAAGLAISQKMNSQIRSINQATRNANDGISMIQTAEGAINSTQDMLLRMKELGTQAASDTIGTKERENIYKELDQLRTEINNLADKTNFNGVKLLDGSTGTRQAASSTLKEGAYLSTAKVAISDVDVSKAKAGVTFTMEDNSTDSKLKLSWTENGQAVSEEIAYADLAVSGNGTSKTITFAKAGVSLTLTNAEAGPSAGADTSADLDTLTVVTESAGNSINLHIGEGTTNSSQMTLSFANVKLSTTGASTEMQALDAAMTAFGSAKTGDSARDLMSAVDVAMDYLSGNRAELGAQMNRLDFTVSSLNTTSENLSASRGRIVDADFATETANLTRAQILQQAGTAMLAQANGLPQNVLSLLRG